MQVITSRDNQYLKLMRSLHSPKGRQQSRLFAAEGALLCREAALYARCSFVLLAEQAASQDKIASLADLFSQQQVPVHLVADNLFAAVAGTENSQGICAAVHRPANQLPQEWSGWFAYADNVADPGNLGTIWRSAHAAGAAALLLSPTSVDAFNPKTVRASMGAAFKLLVYRFATQQEAGQLFASQQLQVLVARANGEDVRALAAKLVEPHVWILGREAGGVQPYWLEQETAGVSLPMHNQAESLNVASAAAVLFYQSYFARHPWPQSAQKPL